MVVDVNDESCLQSEGHSKVSRVSDWRVWERGSDSGELELSAFTLGKRTGGALRVTKVNRRLRVRFPPPPTILSSLPLPTSRSVFFQTPSFTFPRSSGTTKNAVVFGDSDLQVTKPSSDLSEAKNAVVFLQSFELRQKNKTFCVFRSGFDSVSHPVA
ncbi:hypothetical protein CMV_010208 [Castanea mollissima]|uniref:Uncharacterized protein n=1 Tax=Castanea mollissima TaxID=60419 RepID=A0A8J4R4C7_9ROSI|nr:hypothetical protein CMV_010208 [Castanea mollissima]